MADLPIPFSPAMVRAILREIEQPGTGKTQTRRVIKGAPNGPGWHCDRVGPTGWQWTGEHGLPRIPFKPRIAVGDHLYVREHWRVSQRWDETAPRDLPARTMTVFFEAGGEIANQPSGRWEPAPSTYGARPDWVGRFRHGMHMPRWASRLTLTVTDVRVQRLQDISEEDAIAEGIKFDTVGNIRPHFADQDGTADYPDDMKLFWAPDDDSDDCLQMTAVAAYGRLWDQINGAGSWEENPWCSAYTFVPELRNIDQGREAA